jgi:tetraacyldisaccharide 4'-kinase
MNERSYIEVISGRRGGASAAAARAAFGALALPYGLATGLRNVYYDRWRSPTWLDVPVISVGNITAGGTGKTPLCLWVCGRLLERGLKPAVLSRGYRADQEGRADELMLIARRCPKAVAVAHPNRTAAGQMAIEKYHVQAAILDDGFQHRRLGRDLDVVCVDALEPFGYGYILPRGLLREHPKGLRRADAVIITRCDQVEPETLAALERTIGALNPEAPLLRCAHEPTGFVDLDGQEMTLPDSARMGVFAGIGRPEAFARTLTAFRRAPADTFWWPDHHIYTRGDVDELMAWARDAHLDALVTTEKDAVKLARLEVDWPVPVAALRIEIEFWGQGSMILDRLMDEMLEEYAHGGDPPTEEERPQERPEAPPPPPP